MNEKLTRTLTSLSGLSSLFADKIVADEPATAQPPLISHQALHSKSLDIESDARKDNSSGWGELEVEIDPRVSPLQVGQASPDNAVTGAAVYQDEATMSDAALADAALDQAVSYRGAVSARGDSAFAADTNKPPAIVYDDDVNSHWERGVELELTNRQDNDWFVFPIPSRASYLIAPCPFPIASSPLFGRPPIRALRLLARPSGRY